MPIPFGNQNRLGDIEYLCQNVRHGLTYSWQSGSFCWPMVEIPVHRRILGISSWQIQHCIFANPIWHKDSLSDIEYLCQDIRGRAAAFAGISLKFWHTADPHPRESGSWDTARVFLAQIPLFTAGVFLAYDWRSFRTEIFNPVQNELLGYVWSQLWLAASHYGCYHSSPGTPQERQISHRCACTCST
jgi:hypothetical protein